MCTWTPGGDQHMINHPTNTTWLTAYKELRSFRLRVVSPTVCSPTSGVDSPTSNMSARLPLKLFTMAMVDSPLDVRHRSQSIWFVLGLANSNNNCWSSILMFVGAFFRTRNILTHTSFLEQGIFTCLFICVGDNIKLDVGESTLDVGEQTVGETTRRRNDRLPI